MVSQGFKNVSRHLKRVFVIIHDKDVSDISRTLLAHGDT
jgi:hypothetical protein